MIYINNDIDVKVVNLKNGDPYDLYVGRRNSYYNLEESKWHNPIKLEKESDRVLVYKQYKQYILNNNNLYNDLEELNGLTLGCYCVPKKCHATALVDLLIEKRNNINTVLNFFNNIYITYYNYENLKYIFMIDKLYLKNEDSNIKNEKLINFNKILIEYNITLLSGFLFIPYDNKLFGYNKRSLKLKDLLS